MMLGAFPSLANTANLETVSEKKFDNSNNYNFKINTSQILISTFIPNDFIK